MVLYVSDVCMCVSQSLNTHFAQYAHIQLLLSMQWRMSAMAKSTTTDVVARISGADLLIFVCVRACPNGICNC